MITHDIIRTGRDDYVDAVTLLKGQHRQAESLFGQTQAALGDEQRLELLISDLTKLLELHMQIEEHHLYPAGVELEEESTEKSFEEHDLVRDMINKLISVETSDESFPAKLSVLKDLVANHVREEEGSYFPRLQQALGAETMRVLGAAMQFEYLDAAAKYDEGHKLDDEEKDGAEAERRSEWLA